MARRMIDAEYFFQDRIRGYKFSHRFLRDLDVTLTGPEWYLQFDRMAKKLEIVPEDAALRGVFFESDEDAVTVQWFHPSFPKVEDGGLIPMIEKTFRHEDFERLQKALREG